MDWPRSTGTLKVAGLVMASEDLPRLAAGRGTVEFARGSTKVELDGGELDQLAVTSARMDWPRKGATASKMPRCRVISPRPCCVAPLQAQGLEKLAGSVVIDADARGEKELRQPDLWRVSAQLLDASIPLGAGLPPVENLAGLARLGTVSFAVSHSKETG